MPVDRIKRLDDAARSERLDSPTRIQDNKAVRFPSPMLIAKVDSEAAGGGYYNCHLQTLDATDWNSDTADQLDDVGDSVVVLNLAELGVDIHNLDAGDLIACWKFRDDEGTNRLVGVEVFVY